MEGSGISTCSIAGGISVMSPKSIRYSKTKLINVTIRR